MTEVKAKSLSEYKNPFDLDGRLEAHPHITPAKTKAVQNLLEKALSGDIVADAQLREAVSTSDAVFNLGRLLSLQYIPQLPPYLHSLDGLAATRSVPDFDPVALYSFVPTTKFGAGLGASGELPVVPEGTQYPMVTWKGSPESFYQKMEKRGITWGWTWESRLKNMTQQLEQLPDLLSRAIVDTQYGEIFDALLSVSANYASVTTPDGTVVPADAKLTPNALIGAVLQLSLRTINGNQIGTYSDFNVIIPRGTKYYVEYAIQKYLAAVEIVDGAVTFNPIRSNLFPTFNLIESDRLTGSQWIMYPTPGSTPRPVIERLTLTGYESAELRVHNDQGYYAGGGKIAPFEGNFRADQIDFRLRLVTGVALWDSTWIIRSDGSGAAV